MIDAALLDDIAGEVAVKGLGEALPRQLRGKWPDMHFTYCQDDDIATARPVLEREGFNLYLVVGGEGCISFTSDGDCATGIVVAEIEDWEEDR
nr:DUF6129 family protein [uncultured Cohaesibacter sp.]